MQIPAMELPECPVCLGTYDDDVSIPRVLSCGHSICEACLVELPQRYPNTIRCPECIQLVKYPSQQGPSSLPKNIDLLRLSLQHSSSSSDLSKKQNQRPAINGGDDFSASRARFWSDEFYATWKDRILPHDAVSIESEPGGSVRFGSLNSRVCFRGGYLLSSSFDKTVHVWSLQDFSHLHTFGGHENKVMALVYVDDEEPLCISGDSGGGIFVWGITTPFGQDPLKKWYEQKDWRFSGIHSLTVSRNLCLYTGSGDRTIKAWSLKDGTLICTMNGHRSIVSTLAICDEVLYSGSWDGTVRLWSLNDHSPLTVLGEGMPGEMKSILAITVNRHLLVAAYENGCIKVWRNDVFMNSKTLHNGAIFAMNMHGKCLYTGGWDKNVNIQELSGDEFELDVKAFGSIPCSSVVTAILCCQGKIFVGYADKSIKVYHGK